MANNIVVGQNIVYANQTINIASTGITAFNTLIIYCIEANISLSYVPGRTINQITQFVQGKAYLLVALQTMDLTEYLMPPFPSGNAGLVAEDGTQIVPE